jgi:3-phosphoshikimate 1-carboxyvinyltransferase
MENKTAIVRPAQGLTGKIQIPGDKSISHRSVMLAGLASTPVRIKNFLYAQDCLSTVACMRALGVKVEKDEQQDLVVTGNGLYGLTEPEDILDAGNSGTTLRLLAGILAGQSFFSVLTGDASLRKRPMARVGAPLVQMGARLSGRKESRLIPLAILPGPKLQGIKYESPVASAQVKSAVLLATLFADSASTVTEPSLSRDHTERMLEAFGASVRREGASVTVEPAKELRAPAEIIVPGDISSAAFWLVAASIIPGSELVLENVGINPTRTGIIDVLLEMGADIKLINQRWSGKEPVADMIVKSARLKGIAFGKELIPRLVDEIPVLAVAAAFAEGRTVITDASELRVKETDRLTAIVTELGKMGAQVEEKPDGLVIHGPQRLCFAHCHSYHDHRMAMATAIAGAAAGGVVIDHPECVNISYPGFFAILDKVAVYN